jgi:mitochondrial fission protein ELM1
MKTNTTNQQVIKLINRAYNNDGMLINPNSRRNKNEAKAILEADFYNDEIGYSEVNGYQVHTSLLHIAYPNNDI